MYVMSSEGTYINQLAVTKKPISTSFYGNKASNSPFRGMGLKTFLLLMVQLQAASLSYSIDLYLQSNIASYAYQWYQNRGFKLVGTNNIMDLPDTIRQWYNNCQQISYTTPYVHFVTTKVSNNDIKQISKNPNFPEW